MEHLERNRQIALMLGVTLHESQLSMPHPHYTCYHSDWNWLIAAIDKVSEILISKDGDMEIYRTILDQIPDIEATFIAVSNFAKQYNEENHE